MCIRKSSSLAVVLLAIVAIMFYTNNVTADGNVLKISAFKDISAFILESGKAEHLIQADITYVKNADEAHSDLINQRADIVFMSYDDSLFIALETQYANIVAALPIHGGILNFCGNLDIANGKNKIGIDTESGYARALRYYLHQKYPASQDYNQLQWVYAGATNLRYTKLLNGDIDATLLNVPYSYEKGVSRIANMYDAIGPYQGVVANLNKSWLNKSVNANRFAKFAAGFYGRVQKMKAQPQVTIAELQDYYGIAAAEAADVYNRMFAADGLSLSPDFNLKQLEGTEAYFTADTGISVPHQRAWLGTVSETCSKLVIRYKHSNPSRTRRHVSNQCSPRT